MENLPVKIEHIPAVQIFKPAKMDEILKGVKDHVDSIVPDLTTAKGRKDIASLAYKVSQSKTTLDKMGKELVAGKKAEIKLVDNERKKARDFLDNLRDETRQPLDDWEHAEELRIDKILQGIEDIKACGNVENLASGMIKTRIDRLTATEITENTFMECVDQAEFAKVSTLKQLEEAFATQDQYEKDQAELETLRKEKEEREAREEEERLAAEAKARDEKIREAAAAEERSKAKEREVKLKEQKNKAQREKREAKERELKAKQDAKAAAKKAEQEKKEAEARAEQEKKEAAEKARQDEKARQEKEAEDARAAEAERKAQEDHRNKVHQESCRFIKGIFGTTEEQALGIIDAISHGAVPHISIKY